MGLMRNINNFFWQENLPWYEIISVEWNNSPIKRDIYLLNMYVDMGQGKMHLNVLVLNV